MTAFAAIEAATATSAVAALSNATMTLGAASVAVIFDAAYLDTFGIVADTSISVAAVTSAVTAAAVGGTVTIGAVTYTIAEIQPDGTGMTRLMLKT